MSSFAGLQKTALYYFFTLIIILLLSDLTAQAQIIPQTWPSTGTERGNWYPVIINGLPFRDYETSADVSSNAAPSGAQDIASGYNGTNGSQANCNPDYGPPYLCGPETSAFWSCNDMGNTDPTDDWFFFRIRIDGDPTVSGAGAPIMNGKWNILIDYDNDGFKEYWLLLDGNTDTLSIRYDNVNRQGIPAGEGTVTRTFGTNFFRAISIPGSTGSGSGNSKNEWYIDVQAPARCFTTQVESNSSACVGTQQFDCSKPISLLFSTSDSNVDPLQKDFIPNCPNLNQPCSFSSTTPVTLSYFRAGYDTGGTRFNWSTASETSNAGFNIYAQDEDGLSILNTELIKSKVVNSQQNQDYEYISSESDASVFFIADVDIKGKEKLHGPFYIDQEYGTKSNADKIDWESINSEHEEKELKRTVVLKSNSMNDVNKLKSGANSMVKIYANNNIQSLLPGIDILVDTKGIYRVTYQNLVNAGLDLAGVPSSSIALTNLGSPVPIYVYNPTGVFGAGSYIEFIGNGYKTLYTDNNVYILSVNPQLAKRVSTESNKGNIKSFSASYNETLTIDNNNNYYIGSPGDPWYDTLLFSPTTKTINFNIDNLASSGGKITLKLIGGIDFPDYIDHDFIVVLNGVQVAHQSFDGVKEYTTSIDISATGAQLHNGSNELKIIVTGNNAPVDLIYYDSTEIQYPRKYSAKSGSLIFNTTGDAFEVTNLTSPNISIYKVSDKDITKLDPSKVVQSGPVYSASFVGNKTKQYEYYVYNTEAVLSPVLRISQPYTDIKSGYAKYLIISHPDFIGGLNDLINERNAEYSVKTVNVDDIYAQFGYGIFGANAIKEYIKYAYQNMGTEFVLLVGADTYDYKDYLGYGSLSFIPTLYTRTNQFVNYGPSDSLFADVNGDNVQDLAIGRFPVRTSKELSLIIQKTLDYPLTKNNNAVFAADIDDEGISFGDLSDELADYLPAGWSVDRAYLQDLGLTDARNLLLNSLNDPAGSRAFTSFSGHSSYRIWTFSGLFNQNDAAALTNTDNPTVVSQFGCWNTYFVDPLLNTISHKFLLSGTNGAALVAGPSGLANVDAEQNFGIKFYSNIFSGMTVGEASMEAKQEMQSTGQYSSDIILGWNLLGDPALVVAY